MIVLSINWGVDNDFGPWVNVSAPPHLIRTVRKPAVTNPSVQWDICPHSLTRLSNLYTRTHVLAWAHSRLQNSCVDSHSSTGTFTALINITSQEQGLTEVFDSWCRALMERIAQKRKFCHHLLALMLFQTRTTLL